MKPLQRQINLIKDYCDNTGINVNLKKVEKIVFRNGGHLDIEDPKSFLMHFATDVAKTQPNNYHIACSGHFPLVCYHKVLDIGIKKNGWKGLIANSMDPDETAQMRRFIWIQAGRKRTRWEVISNFIKQHVINSDMNAKDVLAKVKELQNKCVAEQQIRESGTNPASWTTDEQKLLGQVLKTYPANTPERWMRIAKAIPTRSKEDCMKIYKQLVELIRAKNAAQEAAKAKK